MKLATLQAGKPLELEGLRITPVPVHHAVPTLGFVIEEDAAAVVIVADTGPTEEIWEYANRTPNLKAVFLEASFPDRMAALAGIAGHLTAAMVGQEVRKLRRRVPVLAVHLKPPFRAQVAQELQALGLPELAVARSDLVYEF